MLSFLKDKFFLPSPQWQLHILLCLSFASSTSRFPDGFDGPFFRPCLGRPSSIRLFRSHFFLLCSKDLAIFCPVSRFPFTSFPIHVVGVGHHRRVVFPLSIVGFGLDRIPF